MVREVLVVKRVWHGCDLEAGIEETAEGGSLDLDLTCALRPNQTPGQVWHGACRPGTAVIAAPVCPITGAGSSLTGLVGCSWRSRPAASFVTIFSSAPPE